MTTERPGTTGFIDVSPELTPVLESVHRQLGEVATIFERQLASELSPVNRLCVHLEKYRGKMLRPMLVELSGLAAAEHPELALTHAHDVVAAVCEMIHTATLVHDDILDEAEVRRKGSTVNHLWGNETAVMLGDYLISNAFHLCSTLGDPSINLALGEVTNTLCEGELLQLSNRGNTGIDRETYVEIVERKTGSLIAACCRLGAQLSGASEETSSLLGTFGMRLGVAFQIQDDLLDLIGDEHVVGKSLGRDLEKGKMTLPLILHLERVSASERGRALSLIERNDSSGIRTMLLESGAVEDTRSEAASIVEDATGMLRGAGLQRTAAGGLLEALAERTVRRSF